MTSPAEHYQKELLKIREHVAVTLSADSSDEVIALTMNLLEELFIRLKLDEVKHPRGFVPLSPARPVQDDETNYS